MKSKFWAYARRFFHCLTHFHRSTTMWTGGIPWVTNYIGCECGRTWYDDETRTLRISSSCAKEGCDDIAFVINHDGFILVDQYDPDPDPDGKWPYIFDVDGYARAAGKIEPIIDILEIGYWTASGEYVPVDAEFLEWRKRNQERHKQNPSPVAAAAD